MKRNTKILAAVLATGVALAGNASAQITAANVAANSFSTDGGGLFSISYSVANPNDVLVVGLYVDNGNSAISSLTFNGANPYGSVAAGSGRLSLFYFDNPTVGTFNFSGTAAQAGQGNCGYIIWELSGVDLSLGVATSSPTPSLNGSTTITTTAANSFIIDFLGVNGAGYQSTPDGDSVLTKTAEVDMNGIFGGGYIASGSVTEAAAGTYNLGWTIPGGTYVGETALAFAPTAVPEPSTFALAGIGLAGLLIFRRRSVR